MWSVLVTGNKSFCEIYLLCWFLKFLLIVALLGIAADVLGSDRTHNEEPTISEDQSKVFGRPQVIVLGGGGGMGYPPYYPPPYHHHHSSGGVRQNVTQTQSATQTNTQTANNNNG